MPNCQRNVICYIPNPNAKLTLGSITYLNRIPPRLPLLPGPRKLHDRLPIITQRLANIAHHLELLAAAQLRKLLVERMPAFLRISFEIHRGPRSFFRDTLSVCCAYEVCYRVILDRGLEKQCLDLVGRQCGDHGPER